MKILKDSAIYLFGEIFAKALPFLLLPYLTRKLGAAGFGELSYYQTFLALLGILLGLGQDGMVARYYYVYGKRNLHNVVFAGYAYTIFMTVIFLVIAWIMNSLIMAAVVGAAGTQCILNVQLTLRQCRKQALAYTVLQIASGILCGFLTVLLLEFTEGESVFKRFFALLLGNAAVSVVAVWYFSKQKSSKIRFSLYRIKYSLIYIMAFGFPLLIHYGANFLKGQLDKIVLYSFYSAEQVGIYSAGLQLGLVVQVFLTSLNKAGVPYYYQALKNSSINVRQIKRWALWSLPISILPALFVWLLLPESLFLWLLGGEQYLGVKWYICLFLFGNGLFFPYYILVNYFFYRGWSAQISIISLFSVIIYLLLLVFTAAQGPQWTPFAMIAGAAVILPLLYRQVKD